jgi:hypothetical protein
VATERSDLDLYVVLTGDAVLVDHDRLDGWINYAYRSLKADRDDRRLERRLDAAESTPGEMSSASSGCDRVGLPAPSNVRSCRCARCLDVSMA